MESGRKVRLSPGLVPVEPLQDKPGVHPHPLVPYVHLEVHQELAQEIKNRVREKS
jgi:hypothetical protein